MTQGGKKNAAGEQLSSKNSAAQCGRNSPQECGRGNKEISAKWVRLRLDGFIRDGEPR
jgi:hypothetical protein